MDKIIVNGKEIEIGPDGRIPLSDEELVSASGGERLPDYYTRYYQWVCGTCGRESEWFDSYSECVIDLTPHFAETGHTFGGFNIKRLY